MVRVMVIVVAGSFMVVAAAAVAVASVTRMRTRIILVPHVDASSVCFRISPGGGSIVDLHLAAD